MKWYLEDRKDQQSRQLHLQLFVLVAYLENGVVLTKGDKPISKQQLIIKFLSKILIRPEKYFL